MEEPLQTLESLESEDIEELKNKNKKIFYNSISYLLVSFYAGLFKTADFGVRYFLKNELDLDTTLFIQISLLFLIPYIIKPIFGGLSDLFPLCGYKRKSYMYLCFFTTIIFWVIFFMSKSEHYHIAIFSLILINLGMSFSNVISDALQTEIFKMIEEKNIIVQTLSNRGNKEVEKEEENSSNILFCFSHGTNQVIVNSAGSIIASLLKGYLLEKYSLDILFYACAGFSILLLMSAVLIYERKIIFQKTQKERKKSIDEINEENEKYKKKKGLKLLFTNKKILILIALLLISESTPVFLEFLFYYETEILKLSPQKLGLIDLFSELSVILFTMMNNYFKFHSLKKIMFCSRFSVSAIFFFLIMLVRNLTQKYIGNLELLSVLIPLYFGFSNLGRLPFHILSGVFSPKNVEATTKALFKFANYAGNILGDCFGCILSKRYKISRGNFNNFDQYLLLVNIMNLIPMVIICLFPKEFFEVTESKGNKETEKK